MKKIYLLFSTIFMVVSLNAQVGLNISEFDLNPIPTLTEAEDALYAPFGAVFLDQRIANVFTLEGNSVVYANFIYLAIKIYDKKVVDEYKTLGLSNIDKKDIIKVVARTSQNGKIIHTYGIDDITPIASEDEEDNIGIEVKDLDAGMTLQFFLLYENENIKTDFGQYIQEEYPILTYDYTIITPSFLNFDLVAYNCDNKAVNEVDDKSETRYITLHFENIPALPAEPICSYKSHLIRIEGDLSYNYSNSNMRLNSHASYAKNVYTNLNSIDKEISKNIDNAFVKANKISSKTAPLKITNSFDFWFKENVNSMHIQSILDIFRPYIYIFNKFDIQYELIITCNKNKKFFDKKYKGTNFFEDILFYLPDIDYYIVPEYLDIVNGLLPSQYINNEALVLSLMKIGKEQSYSYDFRKITLPDNARTFDSTQIDIQFNIAEKMATGKIRRSLMGYIAKDIQANYKNFEQEDYEYMVESFIGARSENTIVKNEKIKNAALEDVAVKPLILTADVSSAEWIRVNHDDLFFYIGKVFGEQFEFEKDTKRQLPIEISYPKMTYRHLTFKIPENYNVSNLSDLNISVYDTDNAATAKAGFTSTYSVDGNTVTVICHEFYNRLNYPVEEFESIKKVYNASAAFYNLQIKMTKE